MGAPPVEEDIFIVGLAGASGSGKSTVAKRVASRLNGQVISMENYSIVMNDLPLEERAKQNYDAPHAIDVKLLENHIREYATGHAVEVPICDFSEHLQVGHRRQQVSASSLLIVEGILALHFAQLRQYFDLSVYMEAPDEVCFHRRKVRDITERGRSLDFILWLYKNNVLPAVREYVLPSKRFANVVLDSAADVATVGGKPLRRYRREACSRRGAITHWISKDRVARRPFRREEADTCPTEFGSSPIGVRRFFK